jgi:penicillin-insensitive murein endopeptidase
MKKFFGIFIVATSFLFLLGAGCASAPDNPWAKVEHPTQDASRSIGRPSAGCLAGAVALPWDGPGFRVVRLKRHRYFGHPRLIHFLEALGAEMDQEKLPSLSIGDLGLPRGGPMPTGHLSHQIGLDVDIWFLKPLSEDREQAASRSVLKNSLLDPALWTETQEKMLKDAVAYDEVDRIFVNPLIKKEFCKKFPKEPWLAKLRPWWGHDDHFHVRLKCPPEDKACINTDPIPSGNGCDSTLEWWFGPEAVEKGKEDDKKSKSRALPLLPDECRDVLQSPS